MIYWRKQNIHFMILVLLFSLSLVGCFKERNKNGNGSVSEVSTQQCSKNLFAMDTYMTVTAYGEQSEPAVNAALEEINRMEQLLSTGIAESEIAILNEKGSMQLSEETAAMVRESLALFEQTEGAFDITVYPLMEEWGFTTGNYQVPKQKKLTKVLSRVNAGNIVLTQSNEASFSEEGMKLDLGGIAKGATSSRIMELFQKYGVTSAIVNLGGNVQVLGSKSNGEAWRVAVENPQDSSTVLGVLEIQDKAVITSGGYERNFEEDGTTYHHILDPSTGYPANSGLCSVTIVSSNGTLADGLSTSLFIMGKEKAVEYWKQYKEEFDFVIQTEAGELLITEGIADAFTTDSVLTIVKG